MCATANRQHRFLHSGSASVVRWLVTTMHCMWEGIQDGGEFFVTSRAYLQPWSVILNTLLIVSCRTLVHQRNISAWQAQHSLIPRVECRHSAPYKLYNLIELWALRIQITEGPSSHREFVLGGVINVAQYPSRPTLVPPAMILPDTSAKSGTLSSSNLLKHGVMVCKLSWSRAPVKAYALTTLLLHLRSSSHVPTLQGLGLTFQGLRARAVGVV